MALRRKMIPMPIQTTHALFFIFASLPQPTGPVDLASLESANINIRWRIFHLLKHDAEKVEKAHSEHADLNLLFYLISF
jgi:hypothetical protein